MLKDLNIQVPNINERNRVPMEAIQVVVEHIAQTFDPEKIILFGSYAYGNPKPWSDVDLLIVIEAEDPKQIQMDINLSFRDPIGLDILVRTPQEIEKRIPLGDFSLREIVSKGKILYERTDLRMDTELKRLKGLLEQWKLSTRLFARSWVCKIILSVAIVLANGAIVSR